MKNYKEVREIAKEIRNWGEKLSINSDYYWRDLSGLCGICTVEIFKKLNFIDNKYIAANENHAFLLLHDNYIIDVTASQFKNYKSPVIIAHKNKTKEKWWEIKWLFKNIKSFKEFQCLQGWPKEQITLAKS